MTLLTEVAVKYTYHSDKKKKLTLEQITIIPFYW